MIESLIPLPPIYSLLNEYLTKSIHLVICEDLIRIFLEDSPKSNQASLSDWMVAVGHFCPHTIPCPPLLFITVAAV